MITLKRGGGHYKTYVRRLMGELSVHWPHMQFRLVILYSRVYFICMKSRQLQHEIHCQIFLILCAAAHTGRMPKHSVCPPSMYAGMWLVCVYKTQTHTYGPTSYIYFATYTHIREPSSTAQPLQYIVSWRRTPHPTNFPSHQYEQQKHRQCVRASSTVYSGHTHDVATSE